MRMRHIVICDLSVFILFSTLYHKRHELEMKKLLDVKCFDFLYNICLKQFSLQYLSETIFFTIFV